MGWTSEQFEGIFNTRLNSEVREELTDKIITEPLKWYLLWK